MKTKMIVALGFCLVMGLGGCDLARGLTGEKALAFMSSPEAQSLLTQIQTGFGQEAKVVVSKINTGMQVVERDRKYICAGVSMANGLFQLAAMAGAFSSSDIKLENVSMLGVNAACSSNITDLTSAVAAVAKTYVTTTSALKDARVEISVPSLVLSPNNL